MDTIVLEEGKLFFLFFFLCVCRHSACIGEQIKKQGSRRAGGYFDQATQRFHRRQDSSFYLCVAHLTLVIKDTIVECQFLRKRVM